MSLSSAGASPAAILRFAGRFLAVFVVALVLWPWLAPAWQTTVSGAANALFGSRTRIAHTAEGGWSYLHRQNDGSEVETVGFDRQGLTLQTLNLLLLPALLLATPAPLGRRLRLLAAGLVLLFAVELATALAWAPVARCLNGDPDDPWCGWTFYALVTGGQFRGVAIWALLAWRPWFAALRGGTSVSVAA